MDLKKFLPVPIVVPNTLRASLARLALLQRGHFLLKYLLQGPGCATNALEWVVELSIIPEKYSVVFGNNELVLHPGWTRIWPFLAIALCMD